MAPPVVDLTEDSGAEPPALQADDAAISDCESFIDLTGDDTEAGDVCSVSLGPNDSERDAYIFNSMDTTSSDSKRSLIDLREEDSLETTITIKVNPIRQASLRHKSNALDSAKKQPKNNPWQRPKSRKAKYRKKRKTVIDAGRIYYPRTMKTLYIREILKLPGIQESLCIQRQQRQAPLSTVKMLYDNNVAPEEDTPPPNSFEIARAVADYSVVDTVLANETAAALRNEVDTIEESVQREETEAPGTTDVDRSEDTRAVANVP